MKKILLSAALLCSLSYSGMAQNTKAKTTTTKTAAPVNAAGTTASPGTVAPASEAPAIIETSPAPQPATTFARPETNNAGGIKAAAGEITMEANVNLFGGTVGLSNALQQVRVRYFLSDDMAVRLGANLRYNTLEPSPGVDVSTMEISIAPGIEKHFAGTERLSPYVGGQLLFGFKRSESKTNLGNGANVKIKGAWADNDNDNRGYFLIGLGGVAGFDFYVARHLFVGYELNLDITNRSFAEVETTTTTSTGVVTRIKNRGNNSALSFGPEVRNGIRVGFVF